MKNDNVLVKRSNIIRYYTSKQVLMLCILIVHLGIKGD